MSEVTFFDCDAEGCTAATRVEDAEGWYIGITTWSQLLGEIDEPVIEFDPHAVDATTEDLWHACTLEHVESAASATMRRRLDQET